MIKQKWDPCSFSTCEITSMFLKEEKICYKIICYTLCLDIVRDCVGKLEFTQVKMRLIRKGARHLKG